MKTELLRPYQVEPAKRLTDALRTFGSAVDLSDGGVGKTWTACAVLEELQLPTLVVCPAILQTQWKQVAAAFNDSHDVVSYELLRCGNTPYGRWENGNPPPPEQREFFVCQTCQLHVPLEGFALCPYHPRGIHCLIRKIKPWRYGSFLYAPQVEAIVFDEIQRCNGLDSLNADMLICAKRQGKKILGLSATIGSSPLHFRALGYALGLHNLNTDVIQQMKCSKGLVRVSNPSFSRWSGKYGVRYDAAFHGLKWFAGESQQLGIMTQIRDSIVPSRGVRISKDSIPDFPAVDITAELFDLEQADKINRIYEQMMSALDALEERKKFDVDNPLTILLRARQQVELLKVPLAVELATDLLEQGVSVGIFVNFAQTIKELSHRLECYCIVDGLLEHAGQRQISIDSFQSNKSKLILVNSAAGGVGLNLQDLHGGHPRGGLVFPPLSATLLRQLLLRFPRDGAKSKSFYRVLLAAGTVETKIHRALRAKLNNMDAVNDGDLNPENLTLSVS